MSDSMAQLQFKLLALLFFINFLQLASALPLCLSQEAPTSANATLKFCNQYSGVGCCSSRNDSDLRDKFQAMNISDSDCANYVKQVLCAQCDPFAADLFKGRSVPILCNSSSSKEDGYCSNVWKACQHVSILNSPFSPNLIGTSPTTPASSLSGKEVKQNDTLTSQWQSESSFCGSLGASITDDVCFQGEKHQFSKEEPDVPPKGMCLDKVADDGYISIVPHPDGSNRAFIATKSGFVYLANLPDEGSNLPLSVNKSAPFLDISNIVVNDRELGLMSVAFHPEFTKNGRFFVSFNCDKQSWTTGCNGRCSCTADVGCDPSQIRQEAGTPPCQYQSVISEFSAGNSPAKALTADSTEVKRIFTMGLPYTTHHGGLLLFGPEDKYLYFMMGDGGSAGDPFNFAQNKKSLLGKILRLDVDKTPSDKEIVDQGLWGKYSIPESNPFVQQSDARPEVWALGLRNPWQCSFDRMKPEYLYCGDVGQGTYEEVDLITKGGNYGWRVFEGFTNYSSPGAPGGTTNASSINPIFPVASYLHNSVNKQQGSASITGGVVSRSLQDPCLYGRYLFADLYGTMFAATEQPTGSGNYTQLELNYGCSKKSALTCKSAQDTTPNFGFVFAWGEDNSRNAYILATGGVFKLVNPANCDFACTKRLPASAGSAPVLTPVPNSPPPPLKSDANRAYHGHFLSVLSGGMLFFCLTLL